MARMNVPAIVILGAGALETARRIRAVYEGRGAQAMCDAEATHGADAARDGDADAARGTAAVDRSVQPVLSTPARCEIHALQGRVGVGGGADVAYTELGAHLRELYTRGTPIVALCAAGIVIRCLAPLLSNKGAEPPVLAVAEDGSAVVPLLGGLAGVNVMARDIATALTVQPAITTSGELRFGTCVLNPPEGYTLADLGQGKRFVSDLLAGASTRIEGDAPWLDDAQLPRDAHARLAIRVTPHAWDGRVDELVIHPRSVVAAVVLADAWGSTDAAEQAQARTAGAAEETGGDAGHAKAKASDNASGTATDSAAATSIATATAEANAHTGRTTAQPAAMADSAPAESVTQSAEAIAAHVRAALDAHGLAALSLAALLAPTARMTHPALAQAAALLNVPLRFADASSAADRSTPEALLHASLRVPHKTLNEAIPNTPDAAAHNTPHETSHEAPHAHPPIALALALTPLAIDPATIGRARGRLTVIGLGPGRADLLAPAARTALNEATDILGYDTYVKMAGPLRADQRVHGTDNREEMQRARHAFELASEGRAVVMVSSGDPGVFAMAAAVLEALDASRDDAWATVELSIVPGVSAALATAAQAGAPLGHDFCMLSLSDNLKPWTIIEKRLRHAAEADLVMAFYNPISRARPWQLDKALDIVREYRAASTEVVLGRDIGRPGGTLRTLTLGELRSSDVDMRTMVIVGSSLTRRFACGADGAQWVYTPRWYE
ncbi:precorrin-3B C(17)-methyltransferase [Burkholderia sp. Ax-1724]|uniref:precorrin-3B C(17)-methyltransferase n=1 Tax=Burkholderia sp. Ax-1724 TaxID=2608336 RepID=UPI001F03A1A2|nr:precorrin-3B C(17)-methyltransferase [Burkholderia sp. Ax-1724]